MGLFGRKNINESVKEFRDDKNARLIDVRDPAEFKAGHLNMALNVPVDKIESMPSRVHDKETTLYLYCATGSRARKAASKLKKLGYKNVKAIGGIEKWEGRIVK